MGEKIIVTINGQVRGTNGQESFGFVADSGELTWTWGLQPGTAILTWAKETGEPPPILPLAAMTIEIGGHTFYGICPESVAVTSHDGRSLTQRFEDSRMLLQFDNIYAQFNFRDVRIVGGQVRTRYRHLLPANYNAHAFTFTNAPYTARQIFDFCFAAQTVESPWTCLYHPALNLPVYDVDADSGKKLGTLLAEVSAKCGATFTLMGGRYRLVWTVKGVGDIPTFPNNATARRSGLTVTDNPTRVRVLGDRNQYQVLDVPLERDWLPAWEFFGKSFDNFWDDLYQHESTETAMAGIAAGTRYNAISGDTDHLIGRQLAAARAETIRVEEYAALRDARDGTGNLYRDYRRANGQSRLQMPVRNYIGGLVYRAFRVPVNFGITNYQGVFMPLAGMDLLDHALTDITHDPVTGVMTWIADTRMVGNGYAIAQGFAVGEIEGMKALRPEIFNLGKWLESQSVWQALPFQIDDSGEDGKFILFEQPVIVTADLMQKAYVEASPGILVEQEFAVLNRHPTITVPPVRAALCFAGERFSVVRGTGTRDDVENVAGLSAQLLVTSTGLVELNLADGDTATQKAVALGDNLLTRQFIYASGGYQVQGSNATQLSSVIDRVTVRLNAGAGLEEFVDFANERARNVDANGRVQIEPVRAFERFAQLLPLFPGEREARERANQLRLQAGALKQNPALARLLSETFYRLMGLDAPPDAWFLLEPDATPIAAGTPLFRDSDEVQPWMPAAAAEAARMTEPVFIGATVRDGEDGQGPVRATRTGNGHLVLLRVKGPVTHGDTVGAPNDPELPGSAMAVDYLQASAHTDVGELVGEGWETETIKLVWVRVAGGGGGRNWRFAGVIDYDKDTQYAREEIVAVLPGNTVVTDGHLDPDSSEIVYTPPGLWVCLRPPKVAIPETEPVEYEIHTPQWPLPVPATTDHADNYWRFISSDPLCG